MSRKTPEGQVKTKLRKYLDTLAPDVKYRMHVPTGYGDTGTLDFTVCFYGRYLAIETKANGRKVTPLQQRAIDDTIAAHGMAMVITDTNIEEALIWLDKLRQALQQSH